MKEKTGYNIIMDEETDYKKIVEDGLSMEAMRNIGLCIDLCCSGYNGFGEIIFRVFNSFNELRDHFRTQHKGVIGKYSFLMRAKMRVNQIIIEQTMGKVSTQYIVDKSFEKEYAAHITPYNPCIDSDKTSEEKIEEIKENLEPITEKKERPKSVTKNKDEKKGKKNNKKKQKISRNKKDEEEEDEDENDGKIKNFTLEKFDSN